MGDFLRNTFHGRRPKSILVGIEEEAGMQCPLLDFRSCLRQSSCGCPGSCKGTSCFGHILGDSGLSCAGCCDCAEGFLGAPNWMQPASTVLSDVNVSGLTVPKEDRPAQDGTANL